MIRSGTVAAFAALLIGCGGASDAGIRAGGQEPVPDPTDSVTTSPSARTPALAPGATTRQPGIPGAGARRARMHRNAVHAGAMHGHAMHGHAMHGHAMHGARHDRGGMGPAGMHGAGMHGGRADGMNGEAPEVPAAPAAARDCPEVDQEMVDEGREIFVGSGACFSCHGGDATGTQLAPDLTDEAWLHVDGSYGAIAELVRTGVPEPQQYPAPMPPMGGAALSAEQTCAVAAYVYSLSQ